MPSVLCVRSTGCCDVQDTSCEKILEGNKATTGTTENQKNCRLGPTFCPTIHAPPPSTPPPHLLPHASAPMRLLTHNVLRSPMKGVENGYPLRIEATDVQVSERRLFVVSFPPTTHSLHISNRFPRKGGAHSCMTCCEIPSQTCCIRYCHLFFPIVPALLSGQGRKYTRGGGILRNKSLYEAAQMMYRYTPR